MLGIRVLDHVVLGDGRSSRLATVGCYSGVNSSREATSVSHERIKSISVRHSCASIHPPPPSLVGAYGLRGRRSIFEDTRLCFHSTLRCGYFVCNTTQKIVGTTTPNDLMLHVTN